MYVLRQVIYLLSLIFSCSCWAESHFLPNMGDIPLMEGLIIQSTEEINFDTPVGQIMNIEVQSENVSSCRILSYYRNVLPEMGWQMIETNKFVREKDTFFITIIQAQNPVILRFEITLNNPVE